MQNNIVPYQIYVIFFSTANKNIFCRNVRPFYEGIVFLSGFVIEVSLFGLCVTVGVFVISSLKKQFNCEILETFYNIYKVLNDY